jgi:hypothetical protein
MTARKLTFKQGVLIYRLREKYKHSGNRNVKILNRILSAFINCSSFNIIKYIRFCISKYKNDISFNMVMELNEIIEQ